MKKILLLATMAMAASSAFAVTDGLTYEAKEGINCKNLWIADRFHNTYGLGQLPFMEMPGKARTACIATLGNKPEDVKILVGYSKTITEGETSNDYAHIVVFDFLSGKYEKTVQCTYEGKPISGLLCANQVGCDSYGHVYMAGYLATTLKTDGTAVSGANAQRVYNVDLETGACTLVNDFALGEDDWMVTNAGRIDYCNLTGDITLQEAPCVYVAAINGATNAVYGFRAEQGATGEEAWQPLMNDGSYYAMVFEETYPAGQAAWGTAPFAVAVKDEDFSGQLIYVDGFTTHPTLYNTTGGIVESFASAPDLAPDGGTGANGVAEFTLNDVPYIVYPLAQYDKTDHKCSIRVAQLGEGSSFEGMKDMWVLPTDGMGDVSDGGTRIHGVDAKNILDENGIDGAFVLTYKCNNGLAVYAIYPDGYKMHGGVNDITVDENNNAPVQYFNLNGVEVSADNLTPGLYITRQGDKGGKVIIK